MDKLTESDQKKYVLVTWLLVGFVIISQLLLQFPSVQIITLGLIIAIQYKAKSLSKLTLGIISFAYIAISILWIVGI
jgi:hypothetical protein